MPNSGRARLDEALPGTVHHQLRLLFLGLHRHEAHVRPLHGLASSRGIGRVVLAALAREPVGGDELRCHQPHGMTVTNEQPRPVVRTGARFHADRARRQRGDQLVQLRPWHARTHELRLAGFIDAVDGEHVLGKIDADGENGQGLPLPRGWEFALPIVALRCRLPQRG
jgi:hypothetical protein